jgi:hypothetical protein
MIRIACPRRSETLQLTNASPLCTFPPNNPSPTRTKSPPFARYGSVAVFPGGGSLSIVEMLR